MHEPRLCSRVAAGGVQEGAGSEVRRQGHQGKVVNLILCIAEGAGAKPV